MNNKKVVLILITVELFDNKIATPPVSCSPVVRVSVLPMQWLCFNVCFFHSIKEMP